MARPDLFFCSDGYLFLADSRHFLSIAAKAEAANVSARYSSLFSLVETETTHFAKARPSPSHWHASQALRTRYDVPYRRNFLPFKYRNNPKHICSSKNSSLSIRIPINEQDKADINIHGTKHLPTAVGFERLSMPVLPHGLTNSSPPYSYCNGSIIPSQRKR